MIMAQVPWKLLGIFTCLLTIVWCSQGDAAESVLLADAGNGYADRFIKVILLQDYNTRVVMCGTVLLGGAAGVIGTFMVLRKRSLVGDVVGHAALPGVAIAFLVMEAVSPGGGKSVPGLLTGAYIAGCLGVVCTMLVSKFPRIREDAAQAIVLSGFFGLGVALLTAIQDIKTGNAAGLNEFIFGKAASLLAADVKMIGIISAILLLLSTALFKEFALLSFDESYAAARGWPVQLLDVVLMGLVVAVCVVGMQSVGMLLVVAMLIIPPSSARFWTDRLGKMTVLSGCLGGLSAFLGVVLSSIFSKLSAGAVIVLCGSFIFILSLMFGVRRGVVKRILRHRRLNRKVGQQDLLRAVYEIIEARLSDTERESRESYLLVSLNFEELCQKRFWSRAELRKLIRQETRVGHIAGSENSGFKITAKGLEQALVIVRNHRLWELYLIQYADVATSQVDRVADRIEHILEPEVIAELDSIMSEEHALPVIASPH